MDYFPDEPEIPESVICGKCDQPAKVTKQDHGVGQGDPAFDSLNRIVHATDCCGVGWEVCDAN